MKINLTNYGIDRMIKITVLGGSGFLGSHLCELLSEKNFIVTIFDKNKSRYKNKKQRFIKGDILDKKALSKAIKGADYVFNFAGAANMDYLKFDPMKTVKYNILGTVNALEISSKFKIKKFIHASTIYANTEEGGFYGRSKKAAEDYVEEFKKKYNLNFTILRFGSIYGPRAGLDNGVRQILENVLFRKRLIYKGTRNSIRRYIYVKDAAKLSLQSLSKKYNNKYLVITGAKKIKANYFFKILSNLFNIRRKKIIYLKNKGHYDIKPTLFKPRSGKILFPKNENFKFNIVDYGNKIKKL